MGMIGVWERVDTLVSIVLVSVVGGGVGGLLSTGVLLLSVHFERVCIGWIE